ncbi:MAG: cobalamin-binding protein [Acidaminococcales bacterium]|nr:cobalamin-binding protein [Acidaminococcales bacterium]
MALLFFVERQTMNKREYIIFILLFFAAAGLAGESALRTSADANRPKKEIKKIVSLSPSNTEILFALGAGDEIVGVTTYCDYPAQALSKEKIGGFFAPDIEKIVLLNPDAILANSTLQSEAIRQLQRAGLYVMPVKNANLDEILESIAIIAQTIGREKEGDALRQKLDAGRRDAKIRLARYTGKPRVFIEVWDKPILTVGRRSYLSGLVAEAGGINVAGGADADYYNWDIEKIYAANPDVYLRLRGNDMGSRADIMPDTLRELEAVRGGRVVTVFGDWIVRPGPRSIEALPQIMDAVYSEGREK